jgi:hypothetical protein
MTLKEFETACDETEQAMKALGITDLEPTISIEVLRECNGDRANIAKGLSGEVVIHGNKTHPSVVLLRVADVRKWLAKARKQGAGEGEK